MHSICFESLPHSAQPPSTAPFLQVLLNRFPHSELFGGRACATPSEVAPRSTPTPPPAPLANRAPLGSRPLAALAPRQPPPAPTDPRRPSPTPADPCRARWPGRLSCLSETVLTLQRPFTSCSHPPQARGHSRAEQNPAWRRPAGPPAPTAAPAPTASAAPARLFLPGFFPEQPPFRTPALHPPTPSPLPRTFVWLERRAVWAPQ